MEPDQPIQCKYFVRKSGGWELPLAIACLLSLPFKEDLFGRLRFMCHLFRVWGYSESEAAYFEPCCWYILLITAGATLCLFGMRDTRPNFRRCASFIFTTSIGVVLITAVLYAAYPLYAGYTGFLVLFSVVCHRQGDEYHKLVSESILRGIVISLPVLLANMLSLMYPEVLTPLQAMARFVFRI